MARLQGAAPVNREVAVMGFDWHCIVILVLLALLARCVWALAQWGKFSKQLKEFLDRRERERAGD